MKKKQTTKQPWSSPRFTEYGTISQLTAQLDKTGSSDDFLTLLLPDLDGSIVPDP